MKNKFAFLSIIALTLVAVGFAVSDERFEYDIAIRGGSLYLGGLDMGPVGDVAIVGDKITAVGEVKGRARREINAAGMIVSPGFIDVHTHTDLPFLYLGSFPLTRSLRANPNYITQGVSTIVTGNCGSGFTTESGLVKWMEKIDKMPFGSNVIHLIPHGELRMAAMGAGQGNRADPKPTAAEMQKMKSILEAGLLAGAWGMSTGLEYDPGARSDIGELVEINSVTAKYGGIYTSHIRNEGPDPDSLLAAISEAITVGERTGTRVEISHIKCSGIKAQGSSGKVIEMIEAARSRGVKVWADQYPYIAGSTTLSYLVPVKYRDGTRILPQYCTDEGRKQLYPEVAKVLEEESPPDKVMISMYPWKPWLQGKTIADIAKSRGEDPVKTAVDMACGPIGTGIYFTQNEDDLKNFMRKDWVATGSDGWVFMKLMGKAHPRVFGTFPRKIRRYAIDRKIITLPFALRSMTELPAEIFDIPNRGKLAAGNFADVVVFNPATIQDNATFEKPNQPSQGIEFLLVNGVVTIENGKITGSRGGKMLKRR